jgi:hypothetical protein
MTPPSIHDHPRVAAAWRNVLSALRVYEQTLVDVMNDPIHETAPIYDATVVDAYLADDIDNPTPPEVGMVIFADGEHPQTILAGSRVVIYPRAVTFPAMPPIEDGTFVIDDVTVMQPGPTEEGEDDVEP